MLKQIRLGLILFLFIIIHVSCFESGSGINVMGSAGTDAAPIAVDEIQEPVINESLPVDVGPTDVQPEGQPQAFIPLPSLQNLAYFPDDNEFVPITGQADAATFPDGGQVVISQNQLSTEETAHFNGLPFIRSAMASETNVCEGDDVLCCPVKADLSYECYFPLSDTSLSQLHIGVVDAGFNVLSSEPEDIQPNLLWLGQVPKDIQVAGSGLNMDGENQGGIGVLGDKRLLQVKEVGGQFKVLGEHVVDYEQVGGLSEDVPQIAFDDSGSLALRDENGGVRLYSSSFVPLTGLERFEFVDSGVVTTVAEADEYTVLERVFSKENWFGVKNNVPTIDAYIYPQDFKEPTNTRRIKIFDDVTSLAGDFKQTNTMDVTNIAGIDIGVAIFQNLADKVFLTLAYKDFSGNRKTVEYNPNLISTAENFKVAIVEDQRGFSSSALERGKIAILNKNNETIYFEEFFADIYTSGGGDFFFPTGGSFVKTGPNPIQMTFDEERNNLMVLNGDNTVHRFNIKKSGKFRRLNKIKNSKDVIRLSDYVTDPLISLDPTSLIVHESDSGKYLVVGMKSLKGVLTVKLSE